MNYRLEIRTLGGLSVRCSGNTISFKQRKTAALLVYLACTNTPHIREALAEMLWENRPQSQSLSNLRVVLTDLRRTVGAYLVITRETVAMNADSDWWLDITDFESGQRIGHGVENLKKIIDLYQGDFLEGFFVDSPLFEDWMRLEREGLRFQAVDLLNMLISSLVSQGNYNGAISNVTRLLQIDSLQEEGHQQMLRCLALSGQRNAALIQYETYRRLLTNELGVEPSNEITTLYLSIRDGTFMAHPSPNVVPPFLSSSQTPDN